MNFAWEVWILTILYVMMRLRREEFSRIGICVGSFPGLFNLDSQTRQGPSTLRKDDPARAPEVCLRKETHENPGLFVIRLLGDGPVSNR